MNKCAFYGSLRKDLFNYERMMARYGADNMRYKSTVTISGYELYSLGQYPAAVAVGMGKEAPRMVVDLFEISDECFNSIKFMELGAGYYQEEINIEGDFYTIFLYYSSILPHFPLVKEGDWKKMYDDEVKYLDFYL